MRKSIFHSEMLLNCENLSAIPMDFVLNDIGNVDKNSEAYQRYDYPEKPIIYMHVDVSVLRVFKRNPMHTSRGYRMSHTYAQDILTEDFSPRSPGG